MYPGANNTVFCPKCGMKHEGTSNICIHCGFDFNTLPGIVMSNATSSQTPVSQAAQITGQTQVQQPTEQNKYGKGTIAFLVISILLVIIVVPLAFQFGVLWLLFGAFSGDAVTYYGILYACLGIILFSVVSLPASIINTITKGRHIKKCLLTVIFLTLLGLATPTIMYKTGFSFSDIGLKDAPIEEGKIILQDGEITVRQEKVQYNDNKIKITLSADGVGEPNPPNTYVRINNCYITGQKIEYDEENNLYTINVDNYYFDPYEIKEPKEIDVGFPFHQGRVNVKIKTNDALENNKQQLSFEEKGLLYENKYFKIVFNQNLKSTVGESDIIIESLTQEKYIVTFTDMDYDTEGYMSDSSLVADLSDYTISSEKIHFNRCKNNLSFIKGKYKITDQANHNEIESGTIDKKFERPLVEKRDCE